MGTLIKQELYKLTHKKGTWIAIGIMVVLQIIPALVQKADSEFFQLSSLISNDYLGGGLYLFIMIASAASIIAMEFQYGTIKQLLYRQYYRSQVFISKLIVIFMQLVVLKVISTIMTFTLTALLFPSFDWDQKIEGSQTLLQLYFLGMGGNVLVTVFLLSVVILIATLLKTNAAAITSGFIGYFVSMAASSVLLLLINKWHWLRFNPFSMLMTSSQIISPDMSQATLMSTPLMITLTFVYTILFTFIAYFSFRKRSV
ncbi:ABC transporter permease [Lapidilactobacillus mulanensis]|uniref:ABC transporter permease n=1 Tax=Lapidilactobacillus mulanensis TaxID=2485999 RepID=A0ABW4DL77_9LACO|nr:ABC transporter permease [Lapidilactobacillus mulanensis]